MSWFSTASGLMMERVRSTAMGDLLEVFRVEDVLKVAG
jgi:hypothetical protein